jgi:predicted permease
MVHFPLFLESNMSVNDLRSFWRRSLRQPGVTLVILLTLAIGIGANTAMFSILDAVLLRPLPFEASDRLVIGRKSYDGNVTSNGPVSGHDWYDYQQQNRSFETLAMMMWGTYRTTVTGGEEPERVDVLFVTWDLFPLLGVSPVLGRFFQEEEAVVGGPPVVMLSYGYWQRRFGGSPDVVGSSVDVNGNPFTIIGVMPADYRFLYDTDAWTLTYLDGAGADARRFHNLLVVGKLREGVGLEQARQDVDIISASLAEQYPESNEGKSLMLTPLRDFMVENVRPSLLLLMATVVLVLLIACGNVAGLLLARGQSRINEVAVRSALGAGRRRLIRQHLFESLFLAILAGLLGIFIALLLQGLVLRLLPLGQVGARPSLDTGVLLFTLVVSVLTGVIFGIVPALRATRVDLARQLRSGARSSEDRRGARLRSALVAFQVAMAVFLLIGSGLLIRSLAGQLGVDLGFKPERLLTASVQVPAASYPDPAQREQFFQEFLASVRSLPGVESATLINQLPIRSPWNDIYAWPVGSPPTSAQDTRSAYDRIVRPGYFTTMGIPLIMGREIEDTDTANSPAVVVIGERMAREFFPEGNPVGQHIIIDMGQQVEFEVVGVVGDVRMTNARSDVYRTMYTAHTQRGNTRMDLAVRTSGPPERITPAIRQVLAGMDRNIPLAEPASMMEVLDRTISGFRVVTLSLGLFSGIALLLTALGLYGVLAFWVSQRLGEFGIRMALGATGGDTVKMIMKRGFALVGLGLVPGLVAAYFGTRLIQQLLFGVGVVDPVSYLGAALFLCATAGVACLLPALRAVRVDPVRVLRME